MENYYKILNIPKNASKDEIKKAYRKMAHQYHPDKRGGDEKKFKEINEAYQVLSDDKKRSQYDLYGQTFQGGGGFEGFEFSEGGFDFSNIFGQSFGIGDIFEEFFRPSRGRAGAGGGFSFKTWSTLELPISLTQAILGGPIEVNTNLGKIKLEIPQGIQSGEAIRYQDGKMNIIFVIKIKIPKNFSKKAKELLEELKKEGF